MAYQNKFEFQEHTADVIVVSYGGSLEEAFENAALALFEVMTDTKTVEPKNEDFFTIKGFDELSLLYEWIENFIIEFDVNLNLYSRFKIEKIVEKGRELVLKAKAWGEVFKRNKHPSRTEVKAITYHEMAIIKNKGVKIKFILDI